MSRFTDALELRLIENADGDAILTSDGRCSWAVLQPLIYDVGAEGSGQTITVPSGATTDLASIPRVVSNILPPDGPWTKAAVVHDFLYRTKGTCVFGGVRYYTGRNRDFTRAEADGVLREAMKVVGVGVVSRSIIWAAVRAGGWRGWGS